MKAFVLFSLLVIGIASCGEPTGEQTDSADTTKIPDSVPQMVRVGKDADWAYKPDSMINDLLLGDAESLKKFKRDNGDEGHEKGGYYVMTYVNTRESELLTVFVTNTTNVPAAFGLRVHKNIRTTKSPPAENYAMAPNFITSFGIYLGMTMEYVQSVYKSQEMMTWSKGDTTYLTYSPKEKDQEHYKRYTYKDYSSQYKFVDGLCCTIEMFVRPEAITE